MNSIVDLFLRSIPIIIGAGVVQLVIFLLKRRTELKNLDAATAKAAAEADSIAVTSAAASLVISDQVRDNAVRRADEAVKRAESLLLELAVQVDKVRSLTSRLATVEAEVEGLKTQIGALREQIKARSA